MVKAIDAKVKSYMEQRITTLPIDKSKYKGLFTMTMPEPQLMRGALSPAYCMERISIIAVEFDPDPIYLSSLDQFAALSN